MIPRRPVVTQGKTKSGILSFIQVLVVVVVDNMLMKHRQLEEGDSMLIYIVRNFSALETTKRMLEKSSKQRA